MSLNDDSKKPAKEAQDAVEILKRMLDVAVEDGDVPVVVLFAPYKSDRITLATVNCSADDALEIMQCALSLHITDAPMPKTPTSIN